MATTNGVSVGARHRSLRDLVCDEMRDRIIEGELAPGERLVERDLADQLEVSRIVVREAIQELAAEGLVTVLPRRGATVAGLDAGAVENLFEVRLSLECLAARGAAERRTEEDLARLEGLLAEAEEATQKGDAKSAAHLNVAFHLAIVAAADNPLLASMVGSLSGQALRLFRIGQDMDAHGLHGEHGELLAAIRAQQAGHAAELMHEHIAVTRAETVARVREMAAGG